MFGSGRSCFVVVYTLLMWFSCWLLLHFCLTRIIPCCQPFSGVVFTFLLRFLFHLRFLFCCNYFGVLFYLCWPRLFCSLFEFVPFSFLCMVLVNIFLGVPLFSVCFVGVWTLVFTILTCCFYCVLTLRFGRVCPACFYSFFVLDLFAFFLSGMEHINPSCSAFSHMFLKVFTGSFPPIFNILFCCILACDLSSVNVFVWV